MTVIFRGLTLICFSAALYDTCNVNVNDDAWTALTFLDPTVNDTSPIEQCKGIAKNENSILILKIFSECSFSQSGLTIVQNGKREPIEQTSEGIIKFVDSTTIKICYKCNVCFLNVNLFYKEIERDGSWNMLNFSDPTVNDTSPIEQCKGIEKNETSFLILKIISECSFSESGLTVVQNEKREPIEQTSKGIIKFIDSSTINICYKSDICFSNISLFYKEIERDGTWTTFDLTDPTIKDTSPVEQCKDIAKNETSFLILKIISECSFSQSGLTLVQNEKRERIGQTSEGIIRFIDSTTIKICYKCDVCLSNVSLFYKEIERTNIVNSFKSVKGSIQPEPWTDCKDKLRYRPNAISFWGIEVQNGSVELTVENLDIDDYAGDYLLVGSSITIHGNIENVLQGPPPLFLTGRSSKPKNIIVDTFHQSLVYIVLVSKTVVRPYASGFLIKYESNSKRIGVASTEAPLPTVAESWKEAVWICASVPKNDSNELVNSTIVSFVVNQAIEKLRENPSAKPINAAQMKVVMLSEERSRSEQYVALLTIEKWDLPNVPLFSADQLREMFRSDRFSYLPGYKILLCDSIPIDGMWLKYATVAFVPIFVFVLFVFWWMQYKTFWSSRRKQCEKKPTVKVEMYPSEMVNPAFEPDSPLPDIRNKIVNKHFNLNEDSGFASCSTYPSSAKSTPRGGKRKVLFSIPSKTANEDEIAQKSEKEEEQKNDDATRL